MNDRPSSAEQRIAAWLDEGPSSGPDDVLAAAHARARSTRQTPGWWLRLRGRTMETTWRARPMPVGRLGLALLLTLLIAALMGGALIVGSRLPLFRDRGLNAVPPAIPIGGDAVFAFSSRFGGSNDDIYTAHADGTDVRRVTTDSTQDFGPSFSPDGTRIAFYANGSGGYALTVVDATGQKTLVPYLGCFSNLQSPVWTADGRFIIYPRTRPGEPTCDDTKLDLYVVPSDGSAEGRRLLPEAITAFTSSASLSPDGTRLALREIDEAGVPSLWVADITDPAAPWDLQAHLVSTTTAKAPFSWDFPRWSADGTLIASTIGPAGDPVKADTIIVSADGSGDRLLWPSPDVDNAWPEWAPDGSRLGVIAFEGIGDWSKDLYDLYLVDPDGTNRTLVPTPGLTGGQGAAFSPDGTRVASLSPIVIDGADHFYVITLDGSSPVVEFTGRTIDWQPVVASLDWAPLAPPQARPVGSSAP